MALIARNRGVATRHCSLDAAPRRRAPRDAARVALSRGRQRDAALLLRRTGQVRESPTLATLRIVNA
jgi:hypothetical protein